MPPAPRIGARGGEDAIFSRTRLLEDFHGDNKLLGGLINTYQQTTPALLHGLRGSIARQHSDDLFRSAHALLSNFRVFGAMRAYTLTRQLEGLGRGGDARNALPTFLELESEATRVGDALEKLAALAA